MKHINIYQAQCYKDWERQTANGLIICYSDVLKKYESRKSIKILDIGGGGGFFAVALKDYFADSNCQVYVLDNNKYDIWEEHTDKVNFIERSVDDLHTLFKAGKFDLIFANRVFHHFVRNSWKESYCGMFEIMKQIAHILKEDGNLCIVDYFYNGFLYDKAPSKIIYTLTAGSFPFIAALCKCLGAKSAGVGVCFLSKRMWLQLFSKGGFIIENLIENKKIPKGAEWYKRVCLCIKKASENNVFILRLSK